MSIVGRPLRGLPFVPPAVPGELFGTWMLRVAEPYGVSLNTLFAHLAIKPVARQHHSHWSTLHPRSVPWEDLAVAVHQPAADLFAMTAPHYRSGWPAELGVCVQCLAHAQALGAPYVWHQCWTHVLTTVCEQHRSWLAPVSLSELRAVHTTRALTQLIQRLLDRDSIPSANAGRLIDDALWVQHLLCASPKVDPPWGAVRPDMRQRMVNIVATILVSTITTALVQALAPAAMYRWLVEDGTWAMHVSVSEDHLGNTLQLVLPRRLLARQLLLGLIGNFLRHSPTQRAKTLGRLPRQMIDKLSISMAAWPAPAVTWICPTTAAFIRRCAELRARHHISPAYFHARTNMLREFSEDSSAIRA